MDAIECLKTRRSIRAYEHKAVPREIVEDIIDCGRLAASAINIQPWLFVAVDDEALRTRIAEITDYGKFISTAPACIVVFCRNVKYFVEDGSAATQNILNAARAHGLCVPGDISVIGCDDIPMAAYAYPPLTTISQPKYRIGKLAVSTLLKMCQDPSDQSGSFMLMESPLIIRESTARVPETR